MWSRSKSNPPPPFPFSFSSCLLVMVLGSGYKSHQTKILSFLFVWRSVWWWGCCEGSKRFQNGYRGGVWSWRGRSKQTLWASREKAKASLQQENKGNSRATPGTQKERSNAESGNQGVYPTPTLAKKMQAVCKLFKAGLFEMCLLSRQYQESRPRRQELLLAEGMFFFFRLQGMVSRSALFAYLSSFSSRSLAI